MRKVRVSVCVALREESSSDFATQKQPVEQWLMKVRWTKLTKLMESCS